MTYGVSEATASRIVRYVEDCLIRSKKFNLPKKLSAGIGLDWDVVIVDATEIVVQRPKKTEKSKGAVHDFERFKRNQHLIPKGSFVLADKGLCYL